MGHHEHSHSHSHDVQHGGDLDPDEVAECPVMPGSMVVKAEAEDEGLVRDYDGKRYYLCCDACGPMWDADPARYAEA